MPLCPQCANLLIPHLVDLACREFNAYTFPKAAFHQHHLTFGDLEQSALGGCDFCHLIVDIFKGTPEPEFYGTANWPIQWQPPADFDNANKSMYAFTRELKVSDVKMALSSHHVYSAMEHTIHEVLAYPIHCETSIVNGAWFTGTPLHIRGFQVGRFQADPDLGSHAVFDLGRRWLNACRENHSGCLVGSAPSLPTRVIDVGTKHSDTWQGLRVVHSRGAKAEYTALSHCWGGKITPLLTTATLATFSQAPPYDALPANFREAITITRQLGIRYLWIDSLCILQDSTQDWASESRRMGNVYGHSTLTISAMAASASADGILRRDTSPAASTPRPATLEVLLSDGCCSVAVEVERSDWEEESLSNLYRDSPLSSRGWTLQELVLSPRHLFYGRRRIYWKCPSAVYSDEASEALRSGPRTPEVAYDDLSSVLYSDVLNHRRQATTDRGLILEAYYGLVEAYSKRMLAFASDKLPAFSGLAQRLQAVVGGDYLAGLWSSDIKNGLLWKFEVGCCRHLTEPYRSPPWSWAVTDGLVLINYHGESKTVPAPYDVQLLEHHVTPRDRDNPFGQVEEAHLVLRGLTKRLVRTKQVVTCRLSNDPSLGMGSFDEPVVDGTHEELAQKGYHAVTDLYEVEAPPGAESILSMSQDAAHSDFSEHDTFEIDTDAFLEGEHLALLVRHHHHEDSANEDGYTYPHSALLCLALRRVAGRDGAVYERVGQLELTRGFDREWLRSWEAGYGGITGPSALRRPGATACPRCCHWASRVDVNNRLKARRFRIHCRLPSSQPSSSSS